jgi:phosphatidate cytidylyltransferase
MTRVISGAALALAAVAAVWLAPLWLLFVVAEALVLLAVREYRHLATALGLRAPWALAAAIAALACAAVALQPIRIVPLSAMLMLGVVGVGTISLWRWNGQPEALASAAVSLFPALYLGLPLGALVAIRERRGAAGLFLLMLTVMASDTSQYYAGRAFGRRPLAAAISPKKTIEGAIGGMIVGTAVLVVAGRWWLTEPVAVAPAARVVLGVLVVAAGIAGDLFESMLKRSAGVKDSSSLIPGHGGLLDRIDALLFAAPVYFAALTFL